MRVRNTSAFSERHDQVKVPLARELDVTQHTVNVIGYCLPNIAGCLTGSPMYTLSARS